MMMVMAIAVFVGAFALASVMIVTSIAPQWQRIMSLASGNVEAGFAPLATLTQAERQIAVRRWAGATPAHATTRSRRAAA